MYQTDDFLLYEDKTFGNIMFKAGISDLIRVNIRPGDSVDIYFSNGSKLKDIPFLSGCILPEGIVCLNAHEAVDWIRVEKRFGRAWDVCGISERETGRIILNKPRKYTTLQNTFHTDISLLREDYPSDEAFTNYREVCFGKIQKGRLYRSTASFDYICSSTEFRIRQTCLDKFLERDRIRFVINMTCEKNQMDMLFDSGIYENTYILKLYREGRIFSNSFPQDYSSAEFRMLLASAMRELIEQNGPYLIQCRAGLDRTGFLSYLLGALTGADQSAATADYMRSYENLCGLTEENNPKKYNLLRRHQADRILKIIMQDGNFTNEMTVTDMSVAAETYLKQCGMTETEIYRLKTRLTD